MIVQLFRDVIVYMKRYSVKAVKRTVAEVCHPLMDLITFLEGSSYPTMNVLAGRLNDIEVKLKLK